MASQRERNNREVRRDSILRNPNMSDSLGRFAFSIAELSGSASEADPGAFNFVQNTVAAEISRIADMSYSMYQMRGGQFSREEYFARDIQARNNLMAQPVDFSVLRDTELREYSNDPTTGYQTSRVVGTLGTMRNSGLRQAFQSQTVGEAAQWLGMSGMSGVLKLAGDFASRFKANEDTVREAITETFASAYEKIFSFNPSKSSEFVPWYQKVAKESFHNWTRNQASQNMTSFSAMGYSSDGEREYSDTLRDTGNLDVDNSFSLYDQQRGDVSEIGKWGEYAEPKQQHWMERIASAIDPNSGKTMLSQRGFYYQSSPYESARFPTSVYNTSGEWRETNALTATQRTKNPQVGISAQDIRAFIPIYEQNKPTWNQYDKIYESIRATAPNKAAARNEWNRLSSLGIDEETVRHTQDYLSLQGRTGPDVLNRTKFIEKYVGRERLEATSWLIQSDLIQPNNLPREIIPAQGSAAFNQWRSGKAFVTAIRDMEGAIVKNAPFVHESGRTIEQFDALENSLQEIVNPARVGSSGRWGDPGVSTWLEQNMLPSDKGNNPRVPMQQSYENPFDDNVQLGETRKRSRRVSQSQTGEYRPITDAEMQLGSGVHQNYAEFKRSEDELLSGDQNVNDYSSSAEIAESERRFQQAINLIPDDTLAAKIQANPGARIPDLLSEEDRLKAQNAYNAYHTKRGSSGRDRLEQLRGNVSSLLKMGRKDLAAELLYTGQNKGAFAASFNFAASANKLDFRYEVGKEAELYDNINRLQKYDPELYGQMSRFFEPKSAALGRSQGMLDRAMAEQAARNIEQTRERMGIPARSNPYTGDGGVTLGDEPARQLGNHPKRVSSLSGLEESVSLFSNTEKEEMGLLYGTVDESGEFTVAGIYKPEQSEKNAKRVSHMSVEQFQAARDAIHEKGMVVLGTAHTHPSGKLVPSRVDKESGMAERKGGVHMIIDPNTGKWSAFSWQDGELKPVSVDKRTGDGSGASLMEAPTHSALLNDSGNEPISAFSNGKEYTFKNVNRSRAGEEISFSIGDGEQATGSIIGETDKAVIYQNPYGGNSIEWKKGASGGNGGGRKPPVTQVSSTEPPEEDPGMWSRLGIENTAQPQREVPQSPNGFTDEDRAAFHQDAKVPDWIENGVKPGGNGNGNGKKPPTGIPTSEAPQPGKNHDGNRKSRSKRTNAFPPGDPRRSPSNWPAQPQKGWKMSYEDTVGMNGEKATIELESMEINGEWSWVEFDSQGNAKPAYNPGYGTIKDANGNTVMEVTHQDAIDYRRERNRSKRDAGNAFNARLENQHTRYTKATSRRNVSEAEIVSSAAQGVGVDYFRQFNNEVYGTGKWTSDGNGGKIWSAEQRNDDGTREQTIAHDDVVKGHSIVQSAAASATTGSLPNDPAMRIATIKQRIWDAAHEAVKKEVDQEIKSTGDAPGARQHGNALKQVVDHFVKAVTKAVEEELGGEAEIGTSNNVSRSVRKISKGATRLIGMNEVNDLLSNSQQARDDLGDNDPEQIYNAKKSFLVRNDQGKFFDIGGQSDYGGSNRSRRNGGRDMWGGGSMGSFLYGSYLLNREINMTIGQGMQQAGRYGEFVSAIGGLGLGEGQSAAATDVGFSARQQIGQRYMDRGAYQTFGGFMDTTYLMSGYGDAPARLASVGNAAFGVAAGGTIAGSMLSSMPGMASAGAAIGSAALGLGVGIAGVGLGIEGYNAFFNQGEDVTLGGIGHGAASMFGLGRAYMDKNGGLNPVNALRFGVDFLRGDLGLEASDLTKQERNLIYGENTPQQVKDILDLSKSTMEETGEGEGSIAQAANLLAQHGLDYKKSMSTLSANAIRNGMSSSQFASQAIQYAQMQGYLPGSEAYQSVFDQYIDLDTKGRALADFSAQRNSALGSQLQALMPGTEEFYGKGVDAVRKYGLDNQSKVGAVASSIGGMQQMGADFTAQQFDQASSFLSSQTPYAGSIIGQAMQQGMMAGMSADRALSFGRSLSGIGMSNNQAFLFDRMMGGDMGAISFNAWQSGNYGSAFYDRSGIPVVQTNGAVAMQVMQSWSPRIGQQGMTSQQFLGTGNAEINNAFLTGGTWEIERLSRQKSYEFQDRQARQNTRSNDLQMAFYWGAPNGTWDSPGSGSMWWYEDKSRAMQNRFQQADFISQQTRMQTSNLFAMEREDLQQQRMDVSNSYNRWQMGFNYNQSIKQREWTRQDWQYQDTTRSLQFGWQMEDIQEGLRYASGRERRQLLRQRDRASISQSLENEQIDTSRDRQQQTWAAEDERYQKTRQYTEELIVLDQEGFEQNKRQRETLYQLDMDDFNRKRAEYEEQRKLNEEITQLQRKHQYDMLMLQKESAAIGVEAAKVQREFNEALINAQQNWQKFTGEIEQMNRYDKAFALTNAVKEMFGTLDNMNKDSVDAMRKMFETLGKMSPEKARAIATYVEGFSR